jgi:hypothetical protein
MCYEKWYTWNVSFEPGATVLVENTYYGDWGGRVDLTYNFEYLIGTAQTWLGTIGNGRVVFDYTNLASSLFLGTTYYSDNTLPEGLTRKIFPDSTVFSYENYLPDWEEVLSVRFLWISNSGLYEGNWDFEANPYLSRQDFDFNFPKAKLRLMRNEIFARHGYIFKDQDLQAYFAGKSWYRKDETFDFNELGRMEQYLVQYLKVLEAK